MEAILRFLSNWVLPYLVQYQGLEQAGTPILPETLGPTGAIGMLLKPCPPFQTAGDYGAVLSIKTIVDKLDDPVRFPSVGWARLWHLHYECIVVGTDGVHTVYIDRDALVRCKEPSPAAGK